MVDASSKYQIIVSAKIAEDDKNGLQGQLDKINFTIKNLTISPEAIKKIEEQISTAIGGAVGGSSGGSVDKGDNKTKKKTPTISDESYSQAKQSFEAEFEMLKASGEYSDAVKESVIYSGQNEEKLQSAKILLTDMAGKTKEISYGWEKVGEGTEESMQFVQKTAKYTDDEIKLEKQRIANQKTINNQIERQVEIAKEGLASAQERDKSNPLVQRFVDANRAVLDYADSIKKSGVPATKEQSQELTKLSNEAKQAEKAMGSIGKATLNIGNQMLEAVKKTIVWAGAMTLLYGSLRKLEQGVQFVKDLNKEMVAIQVLQVDGAKTSDQMYELSKSFNELAISMGTTTQEVAKGSVEWLRQGKTIEQTRDLLKSTTILSKLGNLEAAQATEYLTSVLNGYNLEATKSMSIVDKLVNLDNNYATSVSEIASAMQRSANSANQAGVSLNELASYITIVSSTTRKSSESIGESFSR